MKETEYPVSNWLHQQREEEEAKRSLKYYHRNSSHHHPLLQQSLLKLISALPFSIEPQLEDTVHTYYICKCMEDLPRDNAGSRYTIVCNIEIEVDRASKGGLMTIVGPSEVSTF